MDDADVVAAQTGATTAVVRHWHAQALRRHRNGRLQTSVTSFVVAALRGRWHVAPLAPPLPPAPPAHPHADDEHRAMASAGGGGPAGPRRGEPLDRGVAEAELAIAALGADAAEALAAEVLAAANDVVGALAARRGGALRCDAVKALMHDRLRVGRRPRPRADPPPRDAAALTRSHPTPEPEGSPHAR